MEKIRKNSTIGEIIREYPEIVPVLMEHGIHCIGCHVASFETLEQGFMGHGYSKKEIKKIMKELNEAIQKKYNKTETGKHHKRKKKKKKQY
jgi:hybrid cluster-associated redox disulfide protein